jgi:hypothetical protein
MQTPTVTEINRLSPYRRDLRATLRPAQVRPRELRRADVKPVPPTLPAEPQTW